MLTATIVLADDHELVRQGLCSLLDGEPGIHVLGETSDSSKVLPLCRRLKPQVLVLDLMMPGPGGLAILQQVRQRLPNIKVVVISMHKQEAYVARALLSGASAYVPKDAPADHLVEAIWAVRTGKTYLSPHLDRQAVEQYLALEQEKQDAYELLTGREKEVLPLVAQSLTSKRIAEIMQISPRTVEIYRRNMMRKMGFRNLLDVIRYAQQKGLIEPPPQSPNDIRLNDSK
ncbi:MAG: DNA-binding response regulator [Caldilineae bacterium]|nr:MAG: DNA-binding response regulator [Caldilineae bacterium]